MTYWPYISATLIGAAHGLGLRGKDLSKSINMCERQSRGGMGKEMGEK